MDQWTPMSEKEGNIKHMLVLLCAKHELFYPVVYFCKGMWQDGILRNT